MSGGGSEGRLVPPVGPQDHVQGPAGAPVTLVEYGDYQCPYCGEAYPIVREIQRRLGPQLRFAFRNFPLGNLHPFAPLAAEAAEAAGARGKFWEMHDTLYEHQSALAEKDLVGYAREIGLDVARFHSDLTRHAYASRVREDFMGGVRSGVNGTPTFYINGVRHDGSYDLPELMQAIESQIGTRSRDTRPSPRPTSARRRSPV